MNEFKPVSTGRDFKDVSIEEVRKFWNSRPCNLRHGQASIGSKEYFDQVEARKYYVEPHIPGFADFPNVKNKRVFRSWLWFRY